jgi:hypothetical protein
VTHFVPLDLISLFITFDINNDTIELTRLIRNGQLVGMDLIIGPVYSSNLAKITAYAGKPKFIYHKLQPGETIYSLSKAFGVSDTEIISSNPGIEISKLPVGYEIAIPRRDFMTDRQEFTKQEPNYIFHKVVKGESISSIAKPVWAYSQRIKKTEQQYAFSRR